MAVSCFLAYELEKCEPGSIEDMIAYTLLEDTYVISWNSMSHGYMYAMLA